MAMLEQSVKDEINRLHFDMGLDPGAIASELGIKPPVAVYGVIKQEKVRRGIDKPPAEGRRKVVEIKRETYEVDQATGANGNGHASDAETGAYSSPLFPQMPKGKFSRIEVHRITARPKSAGVGFMGVVDHEADQAVLEEMWGPGRYEVRAFGSKGVVIKSDVIDIPGFGSLPRTDDEETDAGGMLDPMLDPQHPVAQLVAEQRRTNEKLASEVTRLSEKMIEVAQKDASERIKWITQMQSEESQRTRDHYQACLTLVNQKRQEEKPRDFLEEAERFMRIKELFGGDSDGDALTKFVDKLPETLDAVSAMIHGDGIDFDEEEEEAEDNPKAKARNNAAASGKGKEPADYKTIGVHMYRRLIRDGVAPEKAKQMLAMAFKMAGGAVKEARAAKKQKQAAVEPKAEAEPATEQPAAKPQPKAKKRK